MAWNLRRHRGGLKRGVEGCFGFGRRNVAERLEQPAVIVPVDPLKCGIFDGLERPPWTPPMDHLGLEQAVDGFSEGVVVTVSYAADRGFDAGFGKSFCVFYADVLYSTVRVMNESADRSALV